MHTFGSKFGLSGPKQQLAGDALRRTLAGDPEGIEDAEAGTGVPERLGEFDPLTAVEQADWIDALNTHSARLDEEREQILAAQVRREIEIEEFGGYAPSLLYTVLMAFALIAVVFCEAIAIKGAMPILGEVGDLVEWAMAFGFAAAPTLVWKRVTGVKDEFRARRWGVVLQWALFVTPPIVVGFIAWFRFAYRSVEASRYDGTMQAVYGVASVPMLLTLIGMVFLATMAVTFCSDSVDDYCRIQYRRCIIGWLRWKLRRIEVERALIAPLRIQREKRIAAVKEAKKAEYLHAVAVTPVKVPSDYAVAKVLLAVLTFTGLGMILGTVANQLAVKTGLSSVPALLVAVGIAFAISAAGMFAALPYLKKDAPALRPKTLLLPAALMLLVTALLSLTGCTSSEPKESHTVLMLDVSRSVKVTDEELSKAALAVVSRLPRCSELTIIPVNARAGSLFETKLPCERVAYDDDLKEIYKRFRVELSGNLSQWRKSDANSDYKNAFKLAAESLVLSSARTLIVLGDMVDDRGRSPSKKTPPVPALGTPPTLRTLPALPGFSNAKVYVGFLESSELEKLSDEERALFEKNWEAALAASGVEKSKITVRSFGPQGLAAWCDSVFGPPITASGSKGGVQ